MRFQSTSLLAVLNAAAALAQQTGTLVSAQAAENGQPTVSNNWCGQVLTGSGFTEVEATWKLPESYPTQEQYNNQPTYNYQWVGIDGAQRDCQAILQAGTFARVENNSLTYGFWYEFYPKGSWLLNEPAASPGDTVYVKIQSSSDTAGTAYMENQSTGQNTTISLQAPNGSRLCGNTVEWIQENSGGREQTFAPFENFSFTSCSATDSNGRKYGLTGSDEWIMTPTNTELCHSSHLTRDSVEIDYVGPTQ